MSKYDSAVQDMRSRELASSSNEEYVVAGAEHNWFRWSGTRRSGNYEVAAQVERHLHNGLQVYANGSWHPVVGLSHHSTIPAATYTVCGVHVYANR